MPKAGVFGAELKGKSGDRVASFIDENNRMYTRGLDRSQIMQLKAGGAACYIYNVSPIFEHTKSYPRLGTVTIRKREIGERVSSPTVIPGFIVMPYDDGGKLRKMVEVGKDIAEDILCCSEEYPSIARNNLKNYGCFFTLEAPLEDLPKDQQEKLIREAEALHEKQCREKMLEADQWETSHPMWIGEIHRLCALFLREDRRWVAARGKQAETAECPWCGFSHKIGVAICSNCKNVVSQELFDSLQAGANAKKSTPRKEKSA